MRSDPTQGATERVIANVRAELARVDMARCEAAKGIEMPRSNFDRRMAGKTPFSVDELDRLAQLLDIPLLSLINEPPRRRDAAA